MAKQNQPQVVARKESVMTVTDLHGNIVVEVGQTEYTVRLSDGTLVHRANNQHIQTVDGFSWSPPMQLAKPPLYVGICQQCRDGRSFLRPGKSHGVCLLSRSKTCVDCGTLCCPAHRKLGRDQHWRCLWHHRLHLLRSVGRFLLFERNNQL